MVDSRERFEALSARWGDEAIVAALREYVTEPRRARVDAVLTARLFGIEVAVEAPYDPHNAAAVVRSAEAMGLGRVHVVRAHERVLRARATTTGTHEWVDTRHHATLEAFVADVKGRGLVLAGACVGEPTPLEALPAAAPLCLLFGNEHAGLSAAARDACDLRFGIRIYGFAESLNLSVSAALALHFVTQARRRALGRDGDLDPATLLHERARCYVSSVDARLLQGLFGGAGPREVST
jgi:tRNA (guanosine-2'-O-)-methyltransferase